MIYLKYMRPKNLRTTALFLLLAQAAGALAQTPAFTDADWVSLGDIRNSSGGAGIVNATVVDATGNLYIGGFFTKAGGVNATNVAKWNGTSWSALGPGLGSAIYGAIDALAVSGTNLYAGGTFTNSGGVAISKIAQWNGSAWSGLSTGIGSIGIVFALAVSGTNVYAGGSFASAGGVPANYVAQWNGNYWSALNSGQWNCYSVYSLAASGTNLYAGGWFSMAGGVAATNVAQWNGSAWSALGSGLSGGEFPIVYSIAISGSNVYVGGQFTNAGGVAASSIARWNGSTWSALDSGLTGAGDGFGPTVYALAVAGSVLYAGGDFNFAGETPASNIGRWDGSSWSALGSGLNNQVSTLAISDTNLYVGGDFTMAGSGTAAVSLAEALLSKSPATVTLGNLAQAFDGFPKYVSVTTTPPDLDTTVTYNGSGNAPTNVGSYNVIATINDPNYQGSATNTLVIFLQLTAPALSGSNRFQFGLNTASGMDYTIQYSSDLENWIPVLTLSGSGGPLIIFDPSAPGSGHRFYRVKIGP